MRFLHISGFIFVFTVGLFVFSHEADAASLTSASNTISTSRPSPSSPLSANETASATSVDIFNNGSRFLASDSAKIIKSATAAIVDQGLIVSSQSAGLTTVFLGNALNNNAAGSADVFFVPITAMHVIRFTIPTEIPDEGDLEIIFPTLASGDADNDASPSATTFQFNNLVPGGSESNPSNIEVYDDSSGITAAVTVTETEPSAGNAGRLSIEFDTGPIAAGSVITVMLGCSSASDQNTCTAQVPRIINPTKTAAAGTADTWKISLLTEDASNVLLDNATVSIGTIDSVHVQATVDPTLTFTIGGIANNTASNTGNATGCTNNESTNSGIASTATAVNLGILSPANINLSAQLISISTNAAGGYALTATSSGAFRDLATGYDITSDNSLPGTFFTVGSTQFGIHACGQDVNTGDWGSGATGGGANARYAWPTQTTSLTLSSDNSGPIGDTIFSDGDGLVTVKYAGTVSAAVPAGLYQSYITYVATPTF